MSITYRKHPDHPETIIIRELTGDINYNEMVESWQYLIQSNLLKPEIKGILNILNNCQLQITPAAFVTIMDYLKSDNTFSVLKLAVVCDTPQNIVFPTIGENMVKGLIIKPFSTTEAALKWIIEE